MNELFTTNYTDERAKIVKILHLVYSVLLTLWTIAVGVLFIVSCVGVYNTQELSPFTVEAIDTHFTKIAVPVIILPCLIVVGFMLNLLFPLEKKSVSGSDSKKALASLAQRVNLEKTDLGVKTLAIRERNFRFITNIAVVIVALAAIIVSAVFAFDATQYSGDAVNKSVANVTLVVLPATAVACLFYYGAEIAKKISRQRELKILKECVKKDASVLVKQGEIVPSYEPKLISDVRALYNKVFAIFIKNEKIALLVTRIIVVVVAVTFIALGVVNGGMADVLGKAVRICTECIGLG